MKKRGDSEGKDEEARRLWQNVTRSVKAYPEVKKTLPKKPALVQKAAGRPLPLPNIASAKKAPLPSGFDRATETKLRRGELAIEGKLDLHDMTQEQAFNALFRFLQASIGAQKRTLLIITGKGARGEGVLKRMLPLWLEESPFQKHILALTPASAKDGGGGAFYLRLRKQR